MAVRRFTAAAWRAAAHGASPRTRGLPMTSFAEYEALIRGQRPAVRDAQLDELDRQIQALVEHDVRALAELGSARARDAFVLDRAWPTFISHGAFGGTLRSAAAAASLWRELAEAQPLRFTDRLLLPALASATRRVAGWLGVRPDSLVLTHNVTATMNALVRASVLARGSARPVMVLSTGYSSVRKIAAAAGAALTTVSVPLPARDPAAAVAAVESALAAAAADGAQAQLAIFEHVSSDSSVCQPIVALGAACARAGVPLIVDGAHGPLGQPLEAQHELLGAGTWYVGSLHKWACAPKGAGFLYVGPRAGAVRTDGARAGAARTDGALVPAIVSHGVGAVGGGVHSAFAWDGTRDYSAQLAAPAALAVWEQVGAARARAYINALVRTAVAELAASWGEVDVCGSLDPTVSAPMATVSLPLRARARWAELPLADAAVALQDWLHDEHGIEVAIKVLNERLWVRISAHVYNVPADYTRLAAAVRSL